MCFFRILFDSMGVRVRVIKEEMIMVLVMMMLNFWNRCLVRLCKKMMGIKMVISVMVVVIIVKKIFLLFFIVVLRGVMLFFIFV